MYVQPVVSCLQLTNRALTGQISLFCTAAEQPATVAGAPAAAMDAVSFDAVTLAAAVIGHPVPGARTHLPSDASE
ncbi:hypothetical protein BX264_3846 [Streptomyces sp. 2333.5]|nr:hypothetical protein BX264_3846 [Streptomyces sp. 2333.5]SED39281.1 hypothetical protein SAMN05428943_3533 [Streptomyces sp. 2314.4]SEE46486.1 hypothetical protein SAMN05428942_3948 [Streptomyces sp. 2112.2]